MTLASLNVLVVLERRNTISDYRSSVICEGGFIVVSFLGNSDKLGLVLFNENTKLELTKSIE